MKRLSPRISIAALVLMSISIGLVVHAANRDDGTRSSDPIPVVRPDGMDYDPFSHQRNPANPQAASELRSLDHELELFPPTADIQGSEAIESHQANVPDTATDPSNLSVTELIRLPSIDDRTAAPSTDAPFTAAPFTDDATEFVRLPQVATDDERVDHEAEHEQVVGTDQDGPSIASNVGWPSIDNEANSRLPTVASENSRVVTAGGDGSNWTESRMARAFEPAVVAEAQIPPNLNPLPALPPSLRFHEDSAESTQGGLYASALDLAVANQSETTQEAVSHNQVETPPSDTLIQLTNDSISRTIRGESYQEPARWEPLPNMDSLSGTVETVPDQSIAESSSNEDADDQIANEHGANDHAVMEVSEAVAVAPTQPPSQLPESLTQTAPFDDTIASRSDSAPVPPVGPSTDVADAGNAFIIPPISLPPSDLASDQQVESEADLGTALPNNRLGLGAVEEVANSDESLDINLGQQDSVVETSPNPALNGLEIPTVTPSEYRAQAGDQVNSAFQSFLDEQNAVGDNNTQSGAFSDMTNPGADMADARRPLPPQNVLRLDHHVPDEGFSPTVIRATDSVYAAHDPFAPAHMLTNHENISDVPENLDPPISDNQTSTSDSAVEVAVDEGSPSDRVIPVISPDQAPQRIRVSEPIRINSPSEPLVLRDPIRSSDQHDAGPPSDASVQSPLPSSTSEQVTAGPDFGPALEHHSPQTHDASADQAAAPSITQIAPSVIVETLDQELASYGTEVNEPANERQQTASELTQQSSRDHSTRQFVPLHELPGFMANSSAHTTNPNSLANQASSLPTDQEPLKPLTNSDIAATRSGSADSSRSPSDRASVTNHSQANPANDAAQPVEAAQFQADPSNRRVGTLLTQQSQSSFPAESSAIAPISNLQDVAPLPLSQDAPQVPDMSGALGGPVEFDPLDDELLSDPFTGSNPCPVGCPPKYYWMTDIVAYQPNYGDLQISNVVSTDQSFFREGGRVTFGFRGDCLFGWEATLLQLTSASEISSSTTQGVGGPLGTRWIPTGGFNNASLSSFNSPFAQIHLQDHRLEFTSFEFHRTTWGWDVLNTSYGLRIMSFHEEVLFGSSNTAQAIETMPGLFAQSAQNTLIGPQVGITLIDNSRNTLTYDAKGKFGVYADIMDLDTLYQNNSTILLRRNNVEDIGVAFSIELTSGVSWNLTPNWKIRAGVDALYIHGLATLRDQLMPAPAPNTGGALLSNGLGSIISSDDGVFFLGGTIGLYGYWP